MHLNQRDYDVILLLSKEERLNREISRRRLRVMVRRHEIGLEEIKGIRIGQAENTDAGTGCTVFLSDQGMTAGLDVRGGGPASR